MTTSSKLTFKYLVLTTLLLSLTIGTPFIVFQYIKYQVKNDILSAISTVNETTEQSIELWVNETKSTVESWAVKNEILITYVETLLQSPQTNADLTTHLTTEKIRHYFAPLIESKDYKGFFILSPKNINIAASHDDHLGKACLLLGGDDVLKEVIKGKTILSLPQSLETSLHGTKGKQAANLAAMFVTTPIYNKQKQIIAVLSLQMDPSLNFSRLLQLGRIGESGETYAFNRAAKLISESRFDEQLKKMGLLDDEQSAVLNISIRDPGYNLLENKKRTRHIDPMKMPLTLMAESATSGVSSYNLDGYRDYRGVLVIGVWKWNDALGFGISTEIDVNDAFNTLNIIKYAMIFATLFNILLITLLVLKFMQHNRAAKRQSLEDGLTGLANRRMLDIKLETEFSHSLRNGQPLSICMIDIDHFKLFNDRLGHLAGDDALRLVSQLIKDVVKRKIDLVARYGGEEFCVVLPNTHLEEAVKIVENIRRHVYQKKIPQDPFDESSWLTISLGGGCGVEQSDTSASGADQALYLAKRDGRNCVRVSTDDGSY